MTAGHVESADSPEPESRSGRSVELQIESMENRLFELFNHEDTQIAHRTDWFLVFNAILFEAFISAADSESVTVVGFALPIGAFGLVSAFVWFTVGVRQWWCLQYFVKFITQLKPEIVRPQIANFMATMSEARKSHAGGPFFRWQRATPSFCIVIPLACLLVWLTLLILKFRSAGCLTWVTLLVSTVAAGWLSSILGARPSFAGVGHFAADPITKGDDAGRSGAT
jgi:hypothetical protein